MNKIETLDTIFFYFFLPIVIILSLLLSRLYNSRKDLTVKEFQITQGLIIGNIMTGILGIMTSLFLYAYTLNLYPLSILRWEFLAHAFITILALISGIGIGTHIAGVSLEKILRDKLSIPEWSNISKTVHYFHGNLGHRLPFTSLILITYTLTLLDLFRGTTTHMDSVQLGLSLITGIVLGTLFAFLFIITYTSNLMSKITIVTLISIALVTTNESINLLEHPVAFIFTSLYLTIILWIEAKKYLPKKITQKFISLTKHWMKWDGVLLHPDHQIFRKLKSKYYKENRSNKSE